MIWFWFDLIRPYFCGPNQIKSNHLTHKLPKRRQWTNWRSKSTKNVIPMRLLLKRIHGNQIPIVHGALLSLMETTQRLLLKHRSRLLHLHNQKLPLKHKNWFFHLANYHRRVQTILSSRIYAIGRHRSAVRPVAIIYKTERNFLKLSMTRRSPPSQLIQYCQSSWSPVIWRHLRNKSQNKILLIASTLLLSARSIEHLSPEKLAALLTSGILRGNSSM